MLAVAHSPTIFISKIIEVVNHILIQPEFTMQKNLFCQNLQKILFYLKHERSYNKQNKISLKELGLLLLLFIVSL
jgi:hypothetical protein